jgi:predicted TIM-barrel enzyme
MSTLNFKNKPILGMIHLSGSNDKDICLRALHEIQILDEEGVDGVIIENYHGNIDNVVAVLQMTFAQIAYGRRNEFAIGVNILPNDYEKAIDLCNKYQADFIQLDYISGNYTNGEPLNSEHYLSIISKYPTIQILGGVWPKYYSPVKGSILRDDIEQGMTLADAIVVTGQGTGKETPLDKIKEFKTILAGHPLIIGAGLDASNVAEQLPFADGAIVGSCFKPYKRTLEMIDKNLVREFMNEVKKIR